MFPLFHTLITFSEMDGQREKKRGGGDDAASGSRYVEGGGE